MNEEDKILSEEQPAALPEEENPEVPVAAEDGESAEEVKESCTEDESVPTAEEEAPVPEQEIEAAEENAAEENAAEENGEPAEEQETPAEEKREAEPVEEATRVFSVQEAEEGSQSAETKLDGILLACELCEAVQAQVGRDGFHGGIRPDNISVSDGNVKLGSPLEHGIGEFTPQELEYMSPELFWDGSRSGSTDVYSIGLILYSVYNHGLMPFWPVDGDKTPNIRASALQRRMNREEIAPPASAGSELSAIILRALAFAPEERFSDTEELCSALRACHEEQPLATDFSAVLTGMIERSARRAEKQDISSPFVSNIGEEENREAAEELVREEPIPKVKVRRSSGRLARALVYVALALALAAIVLLLRRCVSLDEEARVTPTPPVAEVKEPSEAEKVIGGNITEEEPETAENPEETPGETPEELPEAAPVPQGTVEYVAVRENVSWQEAVRRCEEMGGELAMPVNYEEFQTITAKCEEAGLTFVWLNAMRNEDKVWVNSKGEEGSFFFAWGDGEPSEKDGGDGAAEDYFLLWNHNGRWSGNDSRENPLTSFGHVYGGKIGYVCKKITYESVNITDLGG